MLSTVEGIRRAAGERGYSPALITGARIITYAELLELIALLEAGIDFAEDDVGIASFMGARFTASETAMGPILREAAKRGLIFVDDGTSPRSVAGQIAGRENKLCGSQP